jgi:hypothetical protein
MLLQQPQSIPHKLRFSQRIPVTAMLGFFDASAQLPNSPWR